jgi:hypothetical protein
MNIQVSDFVLRISDFRLVQVRKTKPFLYDSQHPHYSFGNRQKQANFLLQLGRASPFLKICNIMSIK